MNVVEIILGWLFRITKIPEATEVGKSRLSTYPILPMVPSF